MNTPIQERFSVRVALTALVLTATLGLVASSYFEGEAIGSMFLWASMGSLAILHLRLRPKWQEVILLFAGTGLLTAIAIFVFRAPLYYKLPFTFLGLTSLAALAMRAIWADGDERRLLIWGFVPGILFVGFGWLAPLILAYGQVKEPRVLDLYLYSFDCSLRFQPSFLMGRAFERFSWLKQASIFCYLGLPVPILLVYSDQLVRIRKRALTIMLAVLYCAPIGAIFYTLFPAMGPAHIFKTDFPTHTLTIEQARNLFLEPVIASGYRNAMPSLHMSWMLLVWWYSRGLRWWSRGIILTFVILTVSATLGTGEHYLIDLVVAFPFTVMLQGLFAFSLPWKNGQRLFSIFSGLVVTLAWLWLLRFAPKFFWISPVISWFLAVATVLGFVLQQRRLARAVEAEAERGAEKTERASLAIPGGDLARTEGQY